MVKSTVKLLGVQIYVELNFNLHITNICRSANQLNAVIRLQKLLDFWGKKNQISSFWLLSITPDVFLCKILKENKSITKKRVLHFLYNNYNFLFEEMVKTGSDLLKIEKV